MLCLRALVSLLVMNAGLAQAAHAKTSLLQARASRCLDVAQGQFTNGARPQLWDCSAANVNQQWQLVGGQLQAGQSKCLDLVDGNTANGTAVQLWDCGDNNPNQAWELDGAWAAYGAARYFQALLQQTGNNLDQAMRLYNGPIANGGNSNYQKEVATWMSGGNPLG